MEFGARCLMAYRRGEQGEMALLGAALEWEFYAGFRSLLKGLTGK